MIKRILFLLLLISTPTWASHIVGGEFELLHVSDYTYRLNLILYFDVNNGNPGARDNSATVRIFRKSDNSPMMDVFIPFQQQTRVDYFQPDCSNGEIVTDKLVYTTLIDLDPDKFDDPEGYYISWERCCRNYTITNIYSDNPQAGSNYAGQTFYLEFPPVVKNGQPFVNSSPQLFPPLNDYACPNRPYWVDFACVDADMDSLVYSLVNPLNTITAEAIPQGGPRSGPYPTVNWRPGFDVNNITGGTPDLAISNNGFLTVTPASQGLYVFAVKCEEFRAGQKIGEVIRDFQMLVLDKCPAAEPPKILGKLKEDVSFQYEDNMNVQFSNTTADEDRCIQIQVSDPDASKIDDDYIEQIWLKVVALDFLTDQNLTNILPSVSTAVLSNGSTVTFDICFDKCPIFEDRPYTIGVIAFDDACALPLSDTLRMAIDIQPPPNTDTYFITSGTDQTLTEGDDFQLQIEGRDDDGDTLSFAVLTDGFNLADVGMSFSNTTLEPGSLSTTFIWDTKCDVYDFTERTEFQIKLLLEDQDECAYSNPDIITLNLKVNLPPNTDPVISTDLSNLSVLSRLESPIEFTVFGRDSDNDELELQIYPDGFLMEEYGISFDSEGGAGQIDGQFSWLPECGEIDLEARSEFDFLFVLNDLDKCKFPNYDSLEVSIKLLPPDNRNPWLGIDNLNDDVAIERFEATLEIGELLSLDVFANDPDTDSLLLELIPNDSLPEGFTFENTSGLGSIKSRLQWIPECRDLNSDLTGKSYLFSFKVIDDVCYAPLGDTLNLHVNISDIVLNIEDFVPTNVITPNKDGLNEYFSVPNLPEDNCAGQFQSVRIYNRWGTEVYLTTDRDFEWHAENLPAGVYYYVIAYSNKDYNGPISVLY